MVLLPAQSFTSPVYVNFGLSTLPYTVPANELESTLKIIFLFFFPCVCVREREREKRTEKEIVDYLHLPVNCPLMNTCKAWPADITVSVGFFPLLRNCSS
jgi:hypothetical protein